MFARISTYDVPPDATEEAVVEAYRHAIDRIRALDGLHEAYFLLDRGGERAVTITLWDTEAAMEASRVAASRARTEAAHEVDGGVTSTYEYVVAVHERGVEWAQDAG
jgi:heme-degrading monooxygenase HmoA